MYRKFTIPLLTACLTLSCSSGNITTNAVPTRQATPHVPTGFRVEKEINVSFSTYSKDWPVEWQWLDPDSGAHPATYDLETGNFRVRVPGGRDMSGQNRTAPRYIKSLTGDFVIETRVQFLPKENYQGAGLLIFSDNDNFVRFERAYGGTGGGAEGIRLDLQSGGRFTPVVAPGAIQTDADETDLKLVRSGKTFTAFWRPSNDSKWKQAGTVETNFPETIMAGLIVCNTAEEISVSFEYIRLYPPDDPNR